MTVETYRELFHCAAFPVFAVSSKREFLYKNPACGKYFPRLNSRTRPKAIFFPDVPTKSGAVNLLGSEVYRTALALADGENIVILCMARLQYRDGLVVAEQCLKQFGTTLEKFLAVTRCAPSFDGFPRAAAVREDRIYADILHSIRSEVAPWPIARYSLQRAIIPIFERLNTAFSMLGYRIYARITEDFPEYLHIQISYYDLIFLLGRLVYLQMKLSATKLLEIRLANDVARNRHKFVLTTETCLKGLPVGAGDLADCFSALAPECAADFSLLREFGLLGSEAVTVSLDKLGKLTFTYEIPYVSPDTLYVGSTDFSDSMLSDALDRMVDSILARFKDNGASC